MPSNGRITVHVSVGNTQLPEYSKDGNHYVESSLFTPHSYQQEVRELVQGEVEVQSWPVTPYQVEVYVHPDQEISFVKLIIDQVLVDTAIVHGGQLYTFKGFRCMEGHTKGSKEFLFSLPRFAQDEYDRISDSRVSGVGVIEVLQYSAIFIGRRYSVPKYERKFDQANKKDTVRVTKGTYTLATTKKGKMIGKRRFKSRMKNHYHQAELISKLSIQYLMAHALIEKGFELKSIPWVKRNRDCGIVTLSQSLRSTQTVKKEEK